MDARDSETIRKIKAWSAAKDIDTSKAAAALGRKGGKAGTGEAKRRGDGDYYRALRAKRKAQAIKIHIPSHSDCDCTACRPWTS